MTKEELICSMAAAIFSNNVRASDPEQAVAVAHQIYDLVYLPDEPRFPWLKKTP